MTLKSLTTLSELREERTYIHLGVWGLRLWHAWTNDRGAVITLLFLKQICCHHGRLLLCNSRCQLFLEYPDDTVTLAQKLMKCSNIRRLFQSYSLEYYFFS